MGRVISDQFVQNVWQIGEMWRNKKREKKIDNAMAGWNDSPESVIQEVFQIDRNEGMKLKLYHDRETQLAAEAAKAKRGLQMDTLGSVADLLDAADDDPNTDVNQVYSHITPILKGTLGMTDEEVEYYRGAVNQNPKFLKALLGRSREGKPILAAPGTDVLSPDGSTVLHSTPFAPKEQKTVTIKRADGGSDLYVFNPTTGQFENSGDAGAAGAGGGGGGFMDTLAQIESGDQNIPSKVDGDPAGPGTRSQGHFQITTPTWQEFAGAAGVDVKQYPNAMSAPREVQQQVATVIPFGRFGPRTQRMMTEKYGPLDPKATVGALANARGGGSGPRPVITTPGKPGGDRARQLSDAEVAQRKLDPQYRWQEMPNGETKIIGPANKTSAVSAKAQKIRKSVENDLRFFRENVVRLRQHKGLGRITGVSGSFPSIPGGNAADAQAILDSLKSQISLAKLQAMRDASATGGALGNVSNYEIKTLENNFAALAQSQSEKQFKEQLQIIERRIDTMLKDLYADPSGGGGSGGGGGAAQSGPPSAAVEMLRKNPSGQMRKFFDMKYGAGTAAQILGN